MLVKVFSRGTSGSRGVMDYMLGKERDRAGARVLRGNPRQTADLIDSLTFKRRYTSGCLSFEETNLTDDVKTQLMDEFERAIFTGLDHDQYDITWIEHTDKGGRIELNFVIPNVELLTGHRLQPYYDRADRTRINAFQSWANAHFDFADPNDPARHRTLTTASNLPKERAKAAEEITNGLTALILQGLITDRQGVIEALTGQGFVVSRETPQAISITVPGESKPLRLKGAIYERSFKIGSGVPAELTEAHAAYRRDRTQRAEAARGVYEEACRKKSAYHCKRFERTRQADTGIIERNTAQADIGIPVGFGRGNYLDAIDRVSDIQIRNFLNERTDVTSAIVHCIEALIGAARTAISRAFTASSDTFSAGGDNPEPTQQRWLKSDLQQQRKPALSAPDTTWRPEISRGSMPRM